MSASAVYITNFYPLADRRAAPTREDGAFDLFIVSSSAETGILSEPAAIDAIDAAWPLPHAGAARFVSIGCAGLFAGILEFERSGAQRARLLLLESPAGFVQATLDLAGLGAGGDGFVAQDVACIVELSRDPQPGALRVAECRLLAREPTLAGTAKLASRIRANLLELLRRYPGSALVSFDNGSEWARRLAQMLAALCGEEGLPRVGAWLPTVEVELRHFMTVRPVLDLIAHRQRAQTAPLVLTCLGAGGRFGLLALVPDSAVAAPRENGVPPLELGTVTPVRGDAAPLGQALSSMLYTREEYYGRDDFYFKWTLDLSRI
ncbi:hypothetical protein ACT2FY_00770 [Paraburkholderia fungorum]|uniref:hypothetical protein n=1 Tax=Paraburkholderia fungorum TaxID=134537 RepID=UPI00402B13AF